MLSNIKYEYLHILAIPAVNYIYNVDCDEGAVLPSVISIFIALKFWRQAKDQQIILGFLFFAVTMGLFTQYWGITGLHLFTGGFVIWPVLVLLLGDRFPWPLAYPLTFIGTLIPNLYGAGIAADWTGGWFFGVGGAGFRDGLFLVPLETLIVAVVLNQFGIFMRRRGYFNRRVGTPEDVYPEDRDRRALAGCEPIGKERQNERKRP